MNPRSIVFVLVAVLFAGGTAYMANSWLNAQRAALARKEQPKKEVETHVLVAKVNLPMGTFIKEEHLQWQAWPSTAMPKAYIRKTNAGDGKKQIDPYVGAVVRRGITVGEPITDARVVKPGDRGFMAAVLHPDMRAISISVNATSAAAGFIFPGDRVDVLLTHKLRGRRTSETMFTNARVLAVDQTTNDQNAKARLAKTVTLEVTPKQVEMINVARSLGRLSLSLRALPKDIEPEVPQAMQTTVAANDPPPVEWDTHLALHTGAPDGGYEACRVVGMETHIAASDARKAAPEAPADKAADAAPKPLIPAQKPDDGPGECVVSAEQANRWSAAHRHEVAARVVEPPAPPKLVDAQQQIVPGRGVSVTVENEVSRMLGQRGPKVTVVRGRNSTRTTVSVAQDGTLRVVAEDADEDEDQASAEDSGGGEEAAESEDAGGEYVE